MSKEESRVDGLLDNIYGSIKELEAADVALEREIERVEGLIPSLEGYATENFVTGQGYITNAALAGYATEAWVEGKKYATEEALGGVSEKVTVLEGKAGLDKVGTVTSVTIKAGAGLKVSSEDAITESGERTISIDEEAVFVLNGGGAAGY